MSTATDPLRTPRNILIFLASLGLACAVLHAWLPFPEVPEISGALEQLRTAKDEIDTLFIGSSLVRRHISPKVFDARMRERGYPTRSLNLGVDAMTLPEVRVYLDQVLASKPAHLRHVFVDLNLIRLRFAPGQPMESVRSIWWHDLEASELVWRAIEADKTPYQPREKARLRTQHLWVTIRNYSNLGAGVRWLPKTSPAPLDDRGPDRDGFAPLEGIVKGAESDMYRNRLAEMKALGERPLREDAILEAAQSDLAWRIEAAGARAIFVGMPVVGKVRPKHPAPVRLTGRRMTQPVTLEFNDPSIDEVLYDPNHRFDLQHLNHQGALEFTHRLADRFADHLSSSRELDAPN